MTGGQPAINRPLAGGPGPVGRSTGHANLQNSRSQLFFSAGTCCRRRLTGGQPAINRPLAGGPGYSGRSTGQLQVFAGFSCFSLLLLLVDCLLGRVTWALSRSTGQARKVWKLALSHSLYQFLFNGLVDRALCPLTDSLPLVQDMTESWFPPET